MLPIDDRNLFHLRPVYRLFEKNLAITKMNRYGNVMERMPRVQSEGNQRRALRSNTRHVSPPPRIITNKLNEAELPLTAKTLRAQHDANRIRRRADREYIERTEPVKSLPAIPPKKNSKAYHECETTDDYYPPRDSSRSTIENEDLRDMSDFVGGHIGSKNEWKLVQKNLLPLVEQLVKTNNQLCHILMRGLSLDQKPHSKRKTREDTPIQDAFSIDVEKGIELETMVHSPEILCGKHQDDFIRYAEEDYAQSMKMANKHPETPDVQNFSPPGCQWLVPYGTFFGHSTHQLPRGVGDRNKRDLVESRNDGDAKTILTEITERTQRTDRGSYFYSTMFHSSDYLAQIDFEDVYNRNSTAMGLFTTATLRLQDLHANLYCQRFDCNDHHEELPNRTRTSDLTHIEEVFASYRWLFSMSSSEAFEELCDMPLPWWLVPLEEHNPILPWHRSGTWIRDQAAVNRTKSKWENISSKVAKYFAQQRKARGERKTVRSLLKTTDDRRCELPIDCRHLLEFLTEDEEYDQSDKSLPFSRFPKLQPRLEHLMGYMEKQKPRGFAALGVINGTPIPGTPFGQR
ncbi:hypothetical protein GLAREA_07955 [Glarea lozoyensis ATCC 20868]|uniref:Uncharacterized protein n=1 Tax=Glarea lozoyensis (strain ATCC 20868 / MF5171) TaxID=1116229 RepID=S3CDK8_GLAL2|nr:uncharacterized protein GLAREA_07955 [Glarea lozoyensis ATCC 20868]EPE24105.1 hypothetical protein GLAREA_07955 [Glarea lozoyensis ATCC 20868]